MLQVRDIFYNISAKILAMLNPCCGIKIIE